MVLLIIHYLSITVSYFESNAPWSVNLHCPMALMIALQSVQIPARHIHFLSILCHIQKGKYSLNTGACCALMLAVLPDSKNFCKPL